MKLYTVITTYRDLIQDVVTTPFESKALELMGHDLVARVGYPTSEESPEDYYSRYLSWVKEENDNMDDNLLTLACSDVKELYLDDESDFDVTPWHPKAEEPVALVNYYDCYRCSHKWTSVYDCQADDECPRCKAKHVSPIYSR